MIRVGEVLRSPNDPDRAYIRLDAPYDAGVVGLSAFSHVIVLYLLADDGPMQVRGVFATRSAPRPNAIGLSVCELVRVEDELLTLQGLEAPRGAVVLDIKPYDAATDAVPGAVKGIL